MAIIGRTLSFCYVTTEIAPKKRNAHTHDFSQQANTQIWYVGIGSLPFYDAKWMQKTERNTNKNKRESKIKTVCSKANRKRKKRTALNVNLLAIATTASDLTICWSVCTSLNINSWNWLVCLVNYSKIGLPKIKQQYTKCNVRSLDDQIHKQDYKVLSINIEIHNDAWHIGKCIYYDVNIEHIYVCGGPESNELISIGSRLADVLF